MFTAKCRHARFLVVVVVLVDEVFPLALLLLVGVSGLTVSVSFIVLRCFLASHHLHLMPAFLNVRVSASKGSAAGKKIKVPDLNE